MIERATLTRNILIGMAGGLLLGSLIHAIDLADTNPIMVYGVNGLFDIGGKAFVASLKLLVVPLVFVSLACGASNLSDGSSLGRIGIKTVGLYLFTTAIAITLALTVANIVDPGMGMALTTDAVFCFLPPLQE
jgi:Na+/H+-dicarboxylate symporter